MIGPVGSGNKQLTSKDIAGFSFFVFPALSHLVCPDFNMFYFIKIHKDMVTVLGSEKELSELDSFR